MAMLILLVLLIFFAALGIPLAFAIGASCVTYILIYAPTFITMLPQRVWNGAYSELMIAMPLFMLAGELMNTGGITQRIINFCMELLRPVRGGLGEVNIVASMIFGGISGSASADTASIGSIMIPMMVDQGYDADFSTAVTITSSCEGLLVPPSHNMVIYATTAGGISVGSLFLAGYLPGALLAIVLILIATSAVFGNCLTMLHVPDLAANAITSVTEHPSIIALLIDLIILVLGCIMDMAPIILIATPILLPIATSIGIDPIQFPGLKVSVTSDESRAINTDPVPKVIISASGMCDAGRVRHHLKHNLWRKESMVLFVGYQAVGTLGRLLVDGLKKVKLFNEDIEVNAQIDALPGVSGHADKNGLIDWLRGFEEKPKLVFVNHGDPDAADSFTACLNNELGYKAFAPYSGTSFDLLSGEFVTVTKGIPVEKKPAGGRTVSAAFTRLVAAAERLLRLVRGCEGRPNKELARYADQIEAIANKIEK